ncbi:hypothetical protein AB0O64_32325 [Streptomyces sp. NPDC088341]|uniref:hypothetical protein n=1 Tax=Streptomyces sp. NPDC088341 TaxID=3154870 RepID=UPI0034207807
MANENTVVELTVRAEYDTDWHVYIDHPDRGPLGYCIGIGPDEPFDAAAADRALRTDGWRVTSPWTQTPPPAEAPYTTTVTPA